MRMVATWIKDRMATSLGPLSWIMAGGALALLIGLGQLQSGQQSQASDSLLVGSVLLALAWSSRQSKARDSNEAAQ